MTKIQLIDWLRKEAFASAPDGAYKFFQVLEHIHDEDTELTISFSDLDEEGEEESVNPTPRYREDLIKSELRSDGVVCDTHERIWVGEGDIIDWPKKGIDERHPESDDYGLVDVLDETYNIVIAVNGVDTYFRTIDLDW